MSGVQTHNKSTIRKLPLIIKKDSIKSGPNSTGISFRCFPSASGNLIKEDIIYESKAGDFLNGKYPHLCIINRLDLTKNSSRTTAAYTAIDCSVVKLTSDSVVELIGQENYDQVFASLCSVINQELKVKGILSLLSLSAREEKEYSTVGSQTYESSYSDLMREKQRRSAHHNKRRGQFKSYAVQAPKPEPVKKVVIYPDDFKHIEDIKVEDQCSEETLPISDKSYSAHIKAENDTDETSRFVGTESYVKPLGIDPFVDESSNISEVGSIGNISVGSGFSFTDLEGKTVSLLNYIDDHTQFNEYNNEGVMSTIVMLDGSKIMVRGNPDPFHIAMPNILKDLSPNDRRKLLVHQSYLDWKFCLLRDEDNNLPIHLAVLNNDLGLLNRQCLMLKSRQESIDILAAGNLTALQIAIFQDYPECTELLLGHGADVMARDDENRTVLHLAAEVGVRHLAAILTHCRKHAREIFKENEDLWTPELENKSEDKLVSYLLTRLSTLCDSQGYTPLMVASKVGNAAAVELLVRAAPGTINMAMPTCGNTALYLAAAAACTESANRGDKTKLPENYKRTVQILIENGADPAIDNNSGSNVHVLLSEFQDTALSAIIANRLAAYNGYGDRGCGAVMLLKDDKGAIKVTEMKKTDKKNVNVTTNNGKDKSKPNDKANTKTKKNIVQYKSECVARNNNANFKINSNVKPGENVDKSRSANESDKPVILTNLPVVTKIVSYAKDKPVLVKSILVKEGTDNKGLKTKITAKPKTTTSPVNVGSKSLLSTYLKILPKTELEIPNSDIITGSGPQTLSKPKLEPPSIESPTKNKRIIVRHELIKRRPKHDYGESAPSSSKIPKY